MKGLSVAAAVRETGLKQSVLQPLIAALVQQKQIIQVAEFLLSADALQKTREKLVASLETFHKANPLVGGISKEELREKLGTSPDRDGSHAGASLRAIRKPKSPASRSGSRAGAWN